MRQDLIDLGTKAKRVSRAARQATEAELAAMIAWWQTQPELRPDGLRDGCRDLALHLVRHELALRTQRAAAVPLEAAGRHAVAAEAEAQVLPPTGRAVWIAAADTADDLPPGWTLKYRRLGNGELRWSLTSTRDKLLATLEHATQTSAIEEARCRQWLYERGWWLRPVGPWDNPLTSVMAAHYERRLEAGPVATLAHVLAAVEEVEARPPEPPAVPAPPPPPLPPRLPEAAALALTTEANILIRLAPEGPPANLADLTRDAEVLVLVDESGVIFDRARATLCDTVLSDNRITNVFEHQQRVWTCIYQRMYAGDEPAVVCAEVLLVAGAAHAWRARGGDRQLDYRIVRLDDDYRVLGPARLRIEFKKPLEPDLFKRCQRLRQRSCLPAHLERLGYVVERQQAMTGGWLYRARHPKQDRLCTRWHHHQWQAVDALVDLVQAHEHAQAARAARKAERATQTSSLLTAPAVEQLTLF